MTKAERMYGLLNAQEVSDQSIKDFCAQHNITYAQFNYWRRHRKRVDAAASSFAQIRLIEKPFSVRLSGGLQLQFPGDQLAMAADLLLEMDRRHAQF